jgi:hypothetical protein
LDGSELELELLRHICGNQGWMEQIDPKKRDILFSKTMVGWLDISELELLRNICGNHGWIGWMEQIDQKNKIYFFENHGWMVG